MEGKWINEGDVELNAATTLSAGATLVNKGAITVTSTNTLTITAASGTTTPAAVLDNEGMLINDASTNSVIVNGKLIVRASSMYKGAAISITSTTGRIDLYEGYQAAENFTVTSGTLAQVVTSFDNTVTEPVELISGINMLSVSSTLTLDEAITGVNNIELGNGATFNLNDAITVANNTEITTVGDATIKGIYTLSSGAGTLDIIVAKGKTLTLQGVTIAKGTATATLKGADTAENSSSYKLTSGASVAAGVTVADSMKKL